MCLNSDGALHLRNWRNWLEHWIASVFLVNFDSATIAMF